MTNLVFVFSSSLALIGNLRGVTLFMM